MPNTTRKSSHRKYESTMNQGVAIMGSKTDVVKARIKNAPIMPVRAILGIALGGLAGFGLYRYVGCADGTCLITSSPWGSVVYCMILGFVVSQIRWPSRVAKFPPAPTDNDKPHEQENTDQTVGEIEPTVLKATDT